MVYEDIADTVANRIHNHIQLRVVPGSQLNKTSTKPSKEQELNAKKGTPHMLEMKRNTTH